MRKDWSKELERLNFRCGVCRHTWDAAPDLVEPDAEAAHHPFRYFGNCPMCGAKHQPQAAWERSLLKAHQMATGPKTAEGMAATRENVRGHPTPEEALRTRFNGMKHGLSARTATYFPAKPDGYPFCAACEVDRDWCGQQAACVKQTELFMLHHAAFEQRDPKVLSRVHSDLHAGLVASLQMCLQTVLADGVVIKTPKVQLDKDGNSVPLEFEDQNGVRYPIMEYMANPVFKPIADLITRLGLSLSDLGMTVKAAADEEDELRGRLASERTPLGETPESFVARLSGALGNLRTLVHEAKGDASRDEVLLEHEAQSGTSGGMSGGTGGGGGAGAGLAGTGGGAAGAGA